MKRRHFLTMVGATVATGVMNAGCSSGDEEGSGGSGGGGIPVAGTNVRDVPVGFLGSMGERTLLGRDAGGLYAMTSICTHNGCDLIRFGSVTASGLSCGCHGSGFSATGQAIKGPAFNPLQHFRVALGADGTITVDGNAPVDAAVRTPVP